MDGQTQMTPSANYWDGVSEVWGTDQPDRLWRNHSDAVNSRILKNWFPDQPAGTLLKTDVFDETTGNGIVRPRARGSWRTVGIDISTHMLQTAREKGHRLALAAADVRCLPFGTGVFDVVFSNSTLDHFASREPIFHCLGEFYRVLIPGGRLILTMDNPVNPVMALRGIIPYPLLKKAGIVPYFTGKTLSPSLLKSSLQRTGFDVIHLGTILHCPRIFAVHLARWLERWAPGQTHPVYMRQMMRFERLAKLPSRFLTGYFTAVCAIKR